MWRLEPKHKDKTLHVLEEITHVELAKVGDTFDTRYEGKWGFKTNIQQCLFNWEEGDNIYQGGENQEGIGYRETRKRRDPTQQT